MKPEILALADRLAQAGEPFALATVVWARAPSSGKPGATALITADRKVIGWIGGACAEPTVIREALRTLEDGTPRLLFLGTADELAEHQRDGVVTVPIACQSEGALEVYVEPVLPAPHVMVIGRSPAAEALATMALALGWRSSGYDAEASPGGAQGVDRMLDEGRPDLVFADHGFAGAAIEAGVETISIADVNDTALLVAKAQGRTEHVLVFDDHVDPNAYWPVFIALTA